MDILLFVAAFIVIAIDMVLTINSKDKQNARNNTSGSPENEKLVR